MASVLEEYKEFKELQEFKERGQEALEGSRFGAATNDRAKFVPAPDAFTGCENKRLPRITRGNEFTPGASIRPRSE
jgi:hypothetical protein